MKLESINANDMISDYDNDLTGDKRNNGNDKVQLTLVNENEERPVTSHQIAMGSDDRNDTVLESPENAGKGGGILDGLVADY